MSLFSEEMEAFIKTELQGVENKIGINLLNQTFGTDFKVSQLQAWRKRKHCPSGYDAKFSKGTPSSRKGRTWNDLNIPFETQERMRLTCFKKGFRPHNIVQIGTEKTHVDGYVYVKVADGNLNGNWRLKHRLVWEQANGPIPEGMIVFFKDGDRSNCTIENLALVGVESRILAKDMQGIGSDELWGALETLGRLNGKIGEMKDVRQNKE